MACITAVLTRKCFSSCFRDLFPIFLQREGHSWVVLHSVPCSALTTDIFKILRPKTWSFYLLMWILKCIEGCWKSYSHFQSFYSFFLLPIERFANPMPLVATQVHSMIYPAKKQQLSSPNHTGIQMFWSHRQIRPMTATCKVLPLQAAVGKYN